jgi:hypothetical protein
VQGIDGLAHFLQAGGCAAQPRQQAALEARALRVQECRQLFLRQRVRAGVRRRREAEIGEEQVLFRDRGLAEQARQVAIHAVEAQRHVRVPPRELADEGLQRVHRAIDHAHRRRRGLRRAHARKASFDCLAHPRRAAQAHHAQRPAHLVQVLGARLQHRGVLRRGGKLGDRILHQREGPLDLGVDPG